ncbi:MAG TPA: hypothetical protein VK539_01660 [Myxococcaceae bacterium]|nr:hypothetical protein [Myxococcaceae bacterium]
MVIVREPENDQAIKGGGGRPVKPEAATDLVAALLEGFEDGLAGVFPEPLPSYEVRHPVARVLLERIKEGLQFAFELGVMIEDPGEAELETVLFAHVFLTGQPLQWSSTSMSA